MTNTYPAPHWTLTHIIADRVHSGQFFAYASQADGTRGYICRTDVVTLGITHDDLTQGFRAYAFKGPGPELQLCPPFWWDRDDPVAALTEETAPLRRQVAAILARIDGELDTLYDIIGD